MQQIIAFLKMVYLYCLVKLSMRTENDHQPRVLISLIELQFEFLKHV